MDLFRITPEYTWTLTRHPERIELLCALYGLYNAKLEGDAVREVAAVEVLFEELVLRGGMS